MPEEFDWPKSEEMYWAEYGSYTSQVMRNNGRAARERREEMNQAARLLDRMLEALFPQWYFRVNYCHTRLPDMRLIHKDGSPSAVFVKSPFPRALHFSDSSDLK